MPITIKDYTYYRTTEACQMAGISKTTLFRWLNDGVLEDTPYRDRNGWRLFSEHEVDEIKNEASRISRF